MKNLLFPIFLILFNISFAQVAPEKTNCILMTVTNSTEKEIYKDISYFLMDNGFTIEESNEALFYLSTHYKTMGNYKAKFNCYIRGNEIHLSGNFIYNQDIAGPIYKSKSKNSAAARAFAEMDNLAKKYYGGTITYLIK